MKIDFKLAQILLLIFSISFISCGHSESQSVPVDLLGKSIDDLEKTYSSNFKEIKYPVDEDTDATKVAWKLNVRGDHYVVIADDNEDGSVDSIIINDTFFETDKKVKVGDRLDKVMATYSDAEFRGDYNLPELISVYANSGKLKFTFDTSKIDLEKVITQGGFSIENADIAKAPVWKIYIK